MAPNVAPGPGACSSAVSAAFGGFGGGISTQGSVCLWIEVSLAWNELGDPERAAAALAQAEKSLRREFFLRSWLRILPVVGPWM